MPWAPNERLRIVEMIVVGIIVVAFLWLVASR
jgi:hypothetical protein